MWKQVCIWYIARRGALYMKRSYCVNALQMHFAIVTMPPTPPQNKLLHTGLNTLLSPNHAPSTIPQWQCIQKAVIFHVHPQDSGGDRWSVVLCMGCKSHWSSHNLTKSSPWSSCIQKLYGRVTKIHAQHCYFQLLLARKFYRSDIYMIQNCSGYHKW